MTKYLLLATGLILSTPLALAQDIPDPAAPSPPATPATPAIPADPADPANPADKDKDGTKQPEVKKPRASGSARSGGNSLGGTANSESGAGKVRGRSSNATDFAAFDANGDGSLSKDEIKADGSLSGSFKELDKNSDGTLSRGEYESSVRATPPKEPKNPAR
jgi:hypothetical protein